MCKVFFKFIIIIVKKLKLFFWQEHIVPFNAFNIHIISHLTFFFSNYLTLQAMGLSAGRRGERVLLICGLFFTLAKRWCDFMWEGGGLSAVKYGICPPICGFSQITFLCVRYRLEKFYFHVLYTRIFQSEELGNILSYSEEIF